MLEIPRIALAVKAVAVTALAVTALAVTAVVPSPAGKSVGAEDV